MIERLDYSSPHWLRGHADHLARYQFAAGCVAGRRVLDAGTGFGYGAAMLKSSGASHVVAVDIDAETIERARADFHDLDIEFCQDDCEQFTRVTEPVDVICSFENIEHLQNPEAFLQQASRLLAPGGLLIVSTPDKETSPPAEGNRPANPFHVMEWTRAEFADLLGRYFAQVDIRTQVRSHTLEERHAAVVATRRYFRSVNGAVGGMLRHPALRPVLKVVRMVSGRGVAFEPIDIDVIDSLGLPSVHDYPIVPSAVAPLYGTPFCHVALCRNPE